MVGDTADLTNLASAHGTDPNNPSRLLIPL